MCTTVLWNSEEVIRVVKGVGFGRCWNAFGISIDTRTLLPGDIFFAFEGIHVSGASFLQEAFSKGAAAAVVSDKVDISNFLHLRLVQVPDVGKALENLGNYVGKTSLAKKIAITGSVGKTGVKEAVFKILTAQGLTHGSLGNENNAIGVPLSLARLPRAANFGVFEVGMSGPGEISGLSKMIRPSVGVITNIRTSHLQAFFSIAEIAEEKSNIFDGLQPGGTGILNRDDPFFWQLHARAMQKGASKILTFGEHDDSDFRLLDFKLFESSSIISAIFGDRKLEWTISIPGRHWVLNSLCVLASVCAVGGDLNQACLDLGTLKPLKGRGARTKVNLKNGAQVTLIDDCYNASPDSVRMALEVLMLTPKGNGRRIVILGDMKELGSREVEFHLDLIPPLNEAEIDLVFTCGPLMGLLFDELPKSRKGGKAHSAKELLPIVLNAIRSEDVILVKGSRSNRLEIIIDRLQCN